MNIFRHLTAGLKELVRRDKTESELTEELNAPVHSRRRDGNCHWDWCQYGHVQPG